MDGYNQTDTNPFIFQNIGVSVIRTSDLGSIIFICHGCDALMSMFVLVCLLSDTQSHGTSIAV